MTSPRVNIGRALFGFFRWLAPTILCFALSDAVAGYEAWGKGSRWVVIFLLWFWVFYVTYKGE